MNFDPTLLLLSLVPSGVGFVLFMYGRKQQRWPQLVGGLVLMVYPYFVSSATALVAVGLAVGAAVYVLIHRSV
ncbi:MAG: amino acid transport protein [Acidobacteria bacterium]|nr:amino acid transport protein [Acidobacteriota bacterium]